MEQPFSDVHTIEVTAGPADIDENGHVSNLVYLRWVQDAARSHSEAVGWDHARYIAACAAFFVRRHEIDYFAAAMLGDRVKVTTHLASWSAATSIRHTVITREGKELARCVTTWAFVGLNGRPRRIPPDVLESFRRKAPHD